MRRFLALATAIALLAPLGVSAQSFAVAAHVGTLGLGGSVIYGLTPSLNVRGTIGFIPTEPEFTVEEVDFNADFPTFLRATVDYYPLGFLYLSGGGLFLTNGGNTVVEGQLAEPTEFGGTVYDPAQVGTLRGDFGLSGAMPYLGIGLGNPIGSRIGFALDLGVGFGGEPTVDLSASGPIASDPTFQNDLEAEERDFEDDIPPLIRSYPVLSIAISVGIGG
jgi:hypothetical protein